MDAHDKVVALQALLNPAELTQCSDGTVRRFLRAEKGNVTAATKRLQEHLAWRQTHHVDSLVCSKCATDARSHYMHPVGFDLLDRPVLYSCFALANEKSMEGNRDHMIMTFEQTVRLMSPEVEQWVWFADFTGFGYRDVNPAIGKAFLDLASKHYPERLGCFVIVGAPAVFSVLYKAIMALADPVTKAKIRLFPYDVTDGKQPSALRSFLVETFPEDFVAWLVHEMAENRTAAVKTKAYCQTDMHRSASTQAGFKPHYGAKDLTSKFSSCPDLLLPQAASGARK